MEEGGDHRKNMEKTLSILFQFSVLARHSLAFSKSSFFDECTAMASSRAAKASLRVPHAHAVVQLNLKDKRTDRPTDQRTDKQTNKQTNGQTDKQREREKEKKRERERDRENKEKR